jgi:hypothetical protein
VVQTFGTGKVCVSYLYIAYLLYFSLTSFESSHFALLLFKILTYTEQSVPPVVLEITVVALGVSLNFSCFAAIFLLSSLYSERFYLR